MRVVNLAKAKDGLSGHVEYVRKGGRVRILVRGKAVADLVPVEPPAAGEGDDLAALEREGVIRGAAKGKWPKELEQPGPCVRGASAADTLVEERSGTR